MHTFRSLRTQLKKAMTVFAVVAFFLFLGLLGGNALADNKIHCFDRQVAITGLMQSGFAYAGTFITDDGVVLQLYINRSGAWVILAIAPDLNACIALTGVDHAFPFERTL